MIKGQNSFDEFIANATGPIHIYTDGAGSGSTGEGGYGIYMHDAKQNDFELSGEEENTTHNRMEMLAAIQALECFTQMDCHPCAGGDPNIKLIVYTDSQYLKNGINSWIKSWKKNGWRTANRDPVKNQDLWIRLDELQTKLTPHWEWVRGHSNIFGNERADALARNAVVALKMR
ncbi:MAG: ribonuclease HI [Pseudomonadota bacterium]